MLRIPLYTLTCLLGFIHLGQSFEGIPGLYCGLENCYDVLGVTKDTTRDELTRSYRNLARKHHPDRYFKEDEKAEATEKFRLIATAYEVLKDDESRKDYNDMLENPDHYLQHYYRYYRRVYTRRVDVHWVILGTITVISLLQYFTSTSTYKKAIDNCCSKDSKPWRYAKRIAQERGLLPINLKKLRKDSSGSKKNRSQSKAEMREMEEMIIRQIIEENVDQILIIEKPELKNILWIQIFLLPITLYKYISWCLHWMYHYDIKGEEYSREDKEYLICKLFGLNQKVLEHKYGMENLLKRELWKKENFCGLQQAEIRAQVAENPRLKREIRYMKKGGPGQYIE